MIDLYTAIWFSCKICFIKAADVTLKSNITNLFYNSVYKPQERSSTGCTVLILPNNKYEYKYTALFPFKPQLHLR